MRAIYSHTPTEEELEGSGFTVEDYEEEPVPIWPENLKAINLFISISTQWRTGMNGPIGLDYNVLFYRMDRMGLTDADHDELFDDIRTIEAAALNAMNKKD